MSLMKTLAKVAVGVAIAKGVGAVMQNARQPGGSAGTGHGGAGSTRMTQAGTAPGGLEDIMKSVLGGAPSGAGQGAGGASPLPGGLGGLLEQLTGAGGQAGSTGARGGSAGGINGMLEQLTQAAGGAGGGAGGLGDLLGQLTGQKAGGTGGGAGGLGDLLGGLLGGAAAGGAAGNGKSFGDILNSSLQNMGEPDVAPTPHQEAVAALMLRAMVQAAKCDGTIDAAERDKLMHNLEGASPAEMQFVKTLFAAPVDVAGLVRDTPNGLGAQVYTMSVMAIDLDNQKEAEYLHALAQGLGLSQQAVNDMHARLGVPALYA